MKRTVLALIAPIVLLAVPGRALCLGVLQYQPSARSTGMGLTGIADGQDPWNLVRNPAVLGAMEGFFFSGGCTGPFFEDYSDVGWMAGAGFKLKGETNVIRLSAAAHGVNVYRGYSCPDDKYTGFTGAVELNAGNGLIVGLGVTARSLEDVCYHAFPSWLPVCDEISGWEWDYGFRIGYLHHCKDGGRVIAAVGGGLNRLHDMHRCCRQELYGYDSDEDAPWEYRLGISLLLEAGGIHTVNERIGFKAPLVTVMTNIEEDFIEDSDASVFRFGTELSFLKVLYLRTGVNTGQSDSDVTFGAGAGFSTRRINLRLDMSDQSQDRYTKTGAVLSLLLRIGF